MKSASFYECKEATAPSLVLACVLYANDTSVGIVSVYLHSVFVRTSSEMGESAPHFLYFILIPFGASGALINGLTINSKLI